MNTEIKFAATLILAGVTIAATAVDFGNINLGDIQKAIGATQKITTALRDISPQEEQEIGRGMAAGLLGAAPLLNDAEAQRYVNRVGRWCAAQSGRNDVQWRFGVLDDNGINAFAAPGGYIFVTKGCCRMRSVTSLPSITSRQSRIRQCRDCSATSPPRR